MSTNRGEPEPEQWPTYPGVPPDSGQPQKQPEHGAQQPGNAPGQRPYRSPDPEADEAFQAYQDYARARPDPPHQQVQPYQQPHACRPPKDGSAWLQNKWTWIIGGIIAVFVITSLAQGDFPLLPIIFAIVVWQVLSRRKRN